MQIIGNLTRDAEVREVGNHKAITFPVAINEVFRNKNGEKVDTAYFYDCTIWKDDTRVADYLKKGTKIYAEGSPEINVYQDKNGVSKAGVRIRVSHFEILTPMQKEANKESNPDDDFINGK